jgi:glycosyltransferase 2 family protein
MKKTTINIIIISISFIAMLMLIFFTHGIKGVADLLIRMNYFWLAAAFGCIVIYWFLDAAILHFITKSIYKKQRYVNSFKAAMICKLFDSITPFSTGGEPAQAYMMVKDGVKPGHAASIVVIKSVIFQTVFVAYALVVLIFKSSYFISNIHGFFYLFLIGLALNLFVEIMWVLLIYKKEAAYKIILFLFNILSKIKIFRKLKEYEKKIEREFEIYEEGSLILKNNTGMKLKMAALQIAALTVFFAIPFFIYLSIESPIKIRIIDIISAQSIVSMISSYVPSPGSAVAAEGSAYIFFGLFFEESVIIPIVLIWRIITFYSAFLFGGLAVTLNREKPIDKLIDQ